MLGNSAGPMETRTGARTGAHGLGRLRRGVGGLGHGGARQGRGRVADAATKLVTPVWWPDEGGGRRRVVKGGGGGTATAAG